jgi:hypothetical protein
MNLDALIHRKFPPITQQYDAEDTLDLPSSAIVFTTRRLDHEVRVLDLGGSHRAGLTALGSTSNTTLLVGHFRAVGGSRRQEIPPSKTSYSRRFRREGISGAARSSLRTSRFICLKSVKSSPQEKRHH